MNATIKTVLLTILTLSVFTIAMLELSDVSTTKLTTIWDKISGKEKRLEAHRNEFAQREAKLKGMPKTTVEFEEYVHDFGTIKEGDKVKNIYKFKNTGSNPFFIANVTASCGCTIPEYSQEPVMPGDSGTITLEFNSAGKEGAVEKNTLISANTDDAPFPISFKAQVNK